MNDIETCGLIVVTGTKPKTTETDDFRDQVDRVLEMHRDALPREIITMLESPLAPVAIEGLMAAKPIITKMVADKRDAAAKDYPEYEKVQEMLGYASRVFNSSIGDTIKRKLDKHHMRLLEMDAYQILTTKRVEKLGKAIKQMRIIMKVENRSMPRPTPPRHDRKPHASRTNDKPGPKLHEIIVDDGTSKRERRVKKPKPVYTGLPPARTDDTDTSFVNAKPFVKQGAPNPQGPDASDRSRGQTIHVEGNQGKRAKGGGVKTRPGRRN